LAKTSTKKPVPARASAVRKEKVTRTSVGKGAAKMVEWPLEAGKTETIPGASKAPPQRKPVRETAPIVTIAQPAEPVIADQATPSADETVTPAQLLPRVEETKGISIMTDAMETAKTYAEEAKSRFQGAFAEINDKAKVAVEKSTKAIEELGELTKGNFEAIVESSKIASKGIETMSQEAVEYGRKSFEKSTATFKSFASVKTPAEFFQLQSELLTASLDTFASQAARNSEAMLKLAGDVAKPISNRVAIVTDKVKSLAA
jgi:phasin family protein